ncbi:hypothetical protein [Mycolicibacterium aichiense]|uniref:Uncharacterized protein n=1 Tax=Mycolicibacterium aichiense TaxID=1799 RepID=A0AAD1HQN1_9MYCO|nr:hypothetical protein [Mycolicibacterium aichiense]MCV7016294.1 hypothetical protein [Mycolicibacterium aichiense]BBX09937.1 hypothetical protein MAIC_47400 [Mycolicibacterium aichiense]STZ26398.1 Uncharacterised protein [Mycolicibacterium aichiense]
MSDWFQRMTGFTEDGYDSTQRRLTIDGDELVSTVNGKRFSIGELTVPTLADLRNRVTVARGERSSVSALVGDARKLHADPRFVGALFQVASQFNLLEMVSENVTPEQGVTRYASDPTQGPACAIAAGAATIYRNYFVPFEDGIGQTADRQVDALAGVGAALSQLTALPMSALWTMRNGYALCSHEGLAAINGALTSASDDVIDALRGQLAIGLHRDVQVTDVQEPGRRLVSQAFCSALPLGYSRLPRQEWELFARLVLEATYEATLLAAVERAAGGGSNIVLLTRVGGGVFGNEGSWIDHAIERALNVVKDAGLDVRIVGYRGVDPGVEDIIDRWNAWFREVRR